MKRLLLIFSVFAAMTVAHAQQKDFETVLAEHPEFLAGSDYLCPAEAVKLTPAPKGYKPLFLSHYGRHGARYAWQSDMYERLRNVFEQAEEDANLTPYGKEFKSKFDILYPDVRYRVGDLSRKGFEQQQDLASRMYSNFPGIFQKDAKVRAWTSTNSRCVMTMSAFCLGLKAENPKLDIFQNYGKVFLPAIIPQNSSNPFLDKNYVTTPLSFDETREQYIDRTIDYKLILDRLFIDRDKALPEKQWDFVSYLYFFVLGMNNLDSDLDFTAVFTPEEQVQLYKINAFHFYTGKKKDVLFKVLLNGQEATLPMETDNWPYYKWSDFKAQYAFIQ